MDARITVEARIAKLEEKFKALESMFVDWMKGDTETAIKGLKQRVAANEARLKRDSLTDRFFGPDGSVVEGDTTEEDEDPDGSDDEATVQRKNSLKASNPTSTTQLKI